MVVTSRLKMLLLLFSLLVKVALGQDYTTYTDVNQPNPTNEYNPNTNDPRYENPYDPSRGANSRNQYDINRNSYDTNSYSYNINRNPYDSSSNSFDINRNMYEKGNTYEASSKPYNPDQRFNYPNANERRNDPNYVQSSGSQDSTPRPSYDARPSYSYKSNVPLENDNLIINEATYFIVASQMVRPGQIYKIAANILQARMQMTIRASISCNGVEIADASEKVKEGVPEVLNIRVPATAAAGSYRLRVEGLHQDAPWGGRAFLNETDLTFSTRFMTIFIQMDKPVYMQGQTVKFRVIPINTEMRAFGRAIDVFILDPHRRVMKRWLSRQSNFGTVSLQYQLSEQPVFGEWAVRVEAAGQVEEAAFLIEEYYQTKFEVNVTMPAFVLNTEGYIRGRVMANYTSGAPVRGNLTLRATVRPVPRYLPQYRQAGLQRQPAGPARDRVRPNYNPYLYNESAGASEQYWQQQLSRSRAGQPSLLDQPGWWYDPSKVYTRVFNFDEKYPFWMPKPDPTQYAIQQQQQNNLNSNIDMNRNNQNAYNAYSPTYGGDYYGSRYDKLPYLRFFNGTYEFALPMAELAALVPALDGVEVVVTAAVGDPFYDEVQEGFSIARVYNAALALSVLGGSPQVFKPAMPYDVYVVASYQDGSELPAELAAAADLSLAATVEGRGAALQPLRPARLPGHRAVWHLAVDLYKLMRLENDPNYRAVLAGVTGLHLSASLAAPGGARASADLRLVPHYSPDHHHLKISTTTTDARVGEYVIFHVQSNFYIETFNYIVMSKGIILTTGQEVMQEGVRTFAVSVSAGMAPVCTVLAWAAARRGRLLADTITLPVHAAADHRFSVLVNNRKHRTGERVEVAVFGAPGSYVGLAAADSAMYAMQADNQLTYAKVISKMAHFDEATNGTYSFTFRSHAGDADTLVHFPAASCGLDANRTFEYVGLVVFSDVAVPRRPSACDPAAALADCLLGGCYPAHRRCDGQRDCSDGSDEANCERDDSFELAHFRKFRFNRVQRLYDNSWVWRDVNIGPHGRAVRTERVPAAPAHWLLSAFSMDPERGLALLPAPVRYTGVLPFALRVEAPAECRQGEQLGLRAVVFNYHAQALEAVVALDASPDYRFVHVEENGFVRSYNPRTSHGEHQFFVYLAAGDAATLHVPVVFTRLGRCSVTLRAHALHGSHAYTHSVLVQSDGLPQHRHAAVLLDLSTRAYVFQYLHVNVTETPLIPYEVDRYYVLGSNRATLSVVGDVVGPLFPTMPVNATSLLGLPMDSAEQNMFSFAANMYMTLYMRLINQRNASLEARAFHHMNVLYQRQMSYMKPDGSFGLFRSDWNQSESSVWLTSFCAKIFQEASFNEWENYIYIDPEIISAAVSWVLEHQSPEGAFCEVSWAANRNDNSSIVLPASSPLYREQLQPSGRHRDLGLTEVNGSIIMQRNISLTAHVVMMLETVKNLKDVGEHVGLSARVAAAQQRAVGWLERHLRLLGEWAEPLPLALAAAALGAARAPAADHAYRLLRRRARRDAGLVYWAAAPVPPPPYKMENQKPFLLPRLPDRGDAANVAATAYALLACMDHQDDGEPIVAWLNSQRLHHGGWASTQDTYVAMRALIEYTNRKRLRDVSALSVRVEAVALPAPATLAVDNDRLAVMKFVEIPSAWGTVKVTARGAGYAVLQLHVTYNVDVPRFLTPPPLPAFSLRTHAHFHGRNHSHITYQTCAGWTLESESPRSGLAVLDVALPTGYRLQQQLLDQYVLERRVPRLQRAAFRPGQLLFYFHYLEPQETCVNFTIERWFPVANMSRYLPVRVYDYYAPERYNESIFDALPTYLLNICEVCGSSQCPYCATYNAAPRAPAPAPAAAAALLALLAAYAL